MYCCACGETLQPDRAKRFLQHMNATRGGGMAGAGAPRACIVPELQVREDGPGKGGHGAGSLLGFPGTYIDPAPSLLPRVKHLPHVVLSAAPCLLLAQYLMRHAPDCGRELLGPPLDPLLVGVEWCGTFSAGRR